MKKMVFSDTESRILQIIGRRKMTIAEITEKCYGKRKGPFNPTNYVAFVVRQIDQKCKYHRLPWTLTGAGLGRHGRTVWRTKVLLPPRQRRPA